VVYDGTIFLLHVHVIAGSSPEAEELRRFRDRLRTDPNLVASYIASKKAILASGITDSVEGGLTRSAQRRISNEYRFISADAEAVFFGAASAGGYPFFGKLPVSHETLSSTLSSA